MKRIVIFGNSGSGKTTLAKQLAEELGHPHLELDDVAWKEADPPVRHSIEASCRAIDEFISQRDAWIVEGCYGTLIEHATATADQMFFLNIGIDACVANCRNRPWEPGKYATKSAQDKNLEMLVAWVKTYETREDEFSLRKHRKVFDRFAGSKQEITSNKR